MADLIDNFSYALRRLAAQPALLVASTVSLALGIGAVTTAFSVANAFLLRPPAHLQDPESFVTIYTSSAGDDPHGATSFPNYQSLVESSEVLAGAAAARFGMVTVGGEEADQRPERRFVEIVTGNYFEILGAQPVLGRSFTHEETKFGSAERVIVISHAMWRDRFASEPEAIGSQLRLDGHLWTVIGVAPPGLSSRYLPLEVDAWLPVGVAGGVYHATPARLANRAEHDFWVFGRMKEGYSLQQLQAELSIASDSMLERYGPVWLDERGEAREFLALSERDSRLTPGSRTAATGVAAVLLAATGLVLFMVCSNLASLMLGQVGQRRREMAVRVALGAERRQLVLLSMVESLLLALVGGGMGLGIAAVLTRSVGTLPLPMGMPALNFDLSIDPRVVLFSILLSIVTSVGFGLIPALHSSKPNLVPALKGDSTTRGRFRRFNARGLLVVAQLAASFLFVVAAGLLLRGAQASSQIELGFEPEGIALLSKQLPEEEFTPDAAQAYFAALRERLEAHPAIEEAELSTAVEHSVLTPISSVEVEVPGYERLSGESLTVAHNAVTPGYLEMLAIEPELGRSLQETDRAGAPGVAVVTRSFVDRFWPLRENPDRERGSDGITDDLTARRALGRRFAIRDPRQAVLPGSDATREVEVVGIVGDGQFAWSEGETASAVFLWTSFYQEHNPMVLVHARGRQGAAKGVEETVRLLAAEVPSAPGEVSLITPTSFVELISFTESMMKSSSELLALAGVFGLLLAAVGAYGVVSFAVTLRRREMAIRQTLGALPREIFGVAVMDGMFLAGAGVLLGLALAIPLAMVLESMVVGVRAFDPVALGVAVAVLLAVAFAASAVPAIRAASLATIEALRQD